MYLTVHLKYHTDVIEERMRRAEKEMEHISEYDYVVINDTVDNSSNRLLEILEIELEAANKRMCESQ